jgi:hypothetical protein
MNSSPEARLRLAIAAMTDSVSLARRREYADTANAALAELLSVQPPATAKEAEKRGYQQGLLASLACAKEALRTHEDPVTKAEVSIGAGYAVLNGLCHYGQSIVSTFETNVQKALMSTLRKP